MDHSPLDPTRLSPAAQKALAPGPSRMMAARGLVPLPRPAELVAVLYQLAVTDPTLAAGAATTATGLPEKVLAGALADADLDPRVIDWLAPRLADKPAVVEALLLAAATADTTVAAVAARGDARAIDMIAQNEQRLLRHPEIIAAMYQNPRARMSTVERAVELAVRNQIRVPNLACWDEVARALAGGARSTPADDAVFAQAAASLAEMDDTPLVTGDPEAIAGEDEAAVVEPAPALDERKVPINQLSMPAKIRLANLGNAFARAVLVRDPIKMVAMAAIKSPGVTEIEAARLARNQSLSDDVIRFIANRREWTKLYSVKLNLCMNPKNSIPDSARLLPFLRERDLRSVARSKGIPSAVVAQAKKLIAQRSSGGNK